MSVLFVYEEGGKRFALASDLLADQEDLLRELVSVFPSRGREIVRDIPSEEFVAGVLRAKPFAPNVRSILISNVKYKRLTHVSVDFISLDFDPAGL